MPDEIRFTNPSGYDRYMGVWSQFAGAAFLDWLAPASNLDWLDVGCGTGAFAELVLDRCSPNSVEGIDPAEAQIAYARERLGARGARFQVGNAMSLPFADDSFDVSVMPLVIFFMPDPAEGVAEMARVVRPKGIVASYSWDMLGGGFPYAFLREELYAMGIDTPTPPSPDASRMDRLRALWSDAGLVEIRTREITVQRTFVSFDEYWEIVAGGPSVGRQVSALSAADRERFRERLRTRLPAPDTAGRMTTSATANAICGTVR